MSGLRSTLIFTLLTMTVVADGRTERRLRVPARVAEGLCNLSSLPSDIQSRLKTDFSGWKSQDSESLSEYTRKTWADRKPPTCPGIAIGLFQGPKAPAYAVLLVPIDHPDAGYRLVVFTSKTGQPSYDTTVVEQSDDRGASNYFIRKAPINSYFNEESKKKFQVQATDCILMVDSAEQEYEADIYFWANGRFRQEPVDN